MHQFQERRRAFLLIAVSAAIFFNHMVFSAQAQTTMVLAPEGYVDREGVWPSPRIRICWQTGLAQFQTEKRWVQDAIRTHVESSTNALRFVNSQGQHMDQNDWEECRDTDSRAQVIQLRVADERPHSTVGRQWARDARGRKLSDVWGQPIEIPTITVLNFTFEQNFQFAKSDKEHYIRAIAVHEILHALAFLHEQLNPDAPEECRQRYAYERDFPGYLPVGTSYDADSHMNYCANMYRKPIRLSEGDVAVLNRFYKTQ